MDNQLEPPISIQHNSRFRFSYVAVLWAVQGCIRHKTRLQMVFPQTHPKQTLEHDDDLTLLPFWNHFGYDSSYHQTLKKLSTLKYDSYCMSHTVWQNNLRMAWLIWAFCKAKKNSKWKRIASSLFVVERQTTDPAQFAIFDFAYLKYDLRFLFDFPPGFFQNQSSMYMYLSFLMIACQ